MSNNLNQSTIIRRKSTDAQSCVTLELDGDRIDCGPLELTPGTHTLRTQSDFYTLLSLPHNHDDKTLQSRFRRLTVQFHPDKIPSSASAEQRAHVERAYAQLTLAKDTLSEHAKRFAYDRFGPEVLSWRGVNSIRDYVFTGAQRTAGYYAASGAFLVVIDFRVGEHALEGLALEAFVRRRVVAGHLGSSLQPDFRSLVRFPCCDP